MKKHYPHMRSDLMFQDFGPNAPHNFCAECGYRIENQIHNMTALKDELTEEEKEKRRGWLPSQYKVIVCPECGSGCCYCGLVPDEDEDE